MASSTATKKEIEEAIRENNARDLKKNRPFSEKAADFGSKVLENGLAKTVIQAKLGDSRPEMAKFLSNALDNRKSSSENKEEKKALQTQESASKAAERASNRLGDLRRGGSGNKDFSSGWLTFIIILALFVHIYDTYTNYLRPPDFVVISMYALIIIISFFFVSHMKLTGEEGSLFGVIAVCFFLPVLIHYIEGQVQADWLLTITGLIIFFPPLVLYLFLQYPEHSFGTKIIKIYFVIWTIIAVLFLITSPAAQQATAGGKAMIQYPLEGMKFVGQGIGNLYTKAITLSTSAINKAVAEATGQQYEGDQENQRGIFLENLHPVEQIYYTTSDIWVEGRIRAQNIKELVPIRATCIIPDKSLKGDVTPYNFSMTNNDENILDCHLGSLSPGTYEVRMSATFDFQTDAEIKYYFVDNKVNPQTYSKAKIPDKTVAIYTGGPVQVGLPSLHQPLRISANPKDTGNVLGIYPFGVSLTNTWTSGRISQGNQYTLEVPSAVELINCTRNITNSSLTSDRNKYFFKINQQSIRQAYDSVTCRMKIDRPQDLLGANLEYPPERTFNANVTYQYTVEATTYVTVQKDYTGN